MNNPRYGKVTTTEPQADGTSKVETKSYVDNKLDWSRFSVEEIVKLTNASELITPLIELISKIKDGHSTEVSMKVNRVRSRTGEESIVVVKSYLVSKEKM